jgi:hypothetical protein
VSDFDDDYVVAGRRAAQLRDSRFANRESPLVVPVRADAPGRDFDLGVIRPGWTLYSRATDEGRLEAAGVCVEVLHRRVVDDDGEILGERTTFRCLRYWTPAMPWVYLDAGDVDTTQLFGLDRITASAGARWLVKPLVVSRSAHRQKEQLSGSDIERIHDAWRLAGAVAL